MQDAIELDITRQSNAAAPPGLARRLAHTELSKHLMALCSPATTCTAYA